MAAVDYGRREAAQKPRCAVAFYVERGCTAIVWQLSLRSTFKVLGCWHEGYQAARSALVDQRGMSIWCPVLAMLSNRASSGLTVISLQLKSYSRFECLLKHRVLPTETRLFLPFSKPRYPRNLASRNPERSPHRQETRHGTGHAVRHRARALNEE